MRFEELVIEKYGVYQTLSVGLDAAPGLAVIYGPNEAGKSTCLAATLDFLFGIPVTSPYGQVFGYDQMRIGATLRLADGRRIVLRRRKGRVRTLTDGNGNPVDDSRLDLILGATTRDRFGALFGLDHSSLRDGGTRLLEAQGDIGRLIVEAGGGLRDLVKTIDTLRDEADRLFGQRYSAGRDFYKARDAFEGADKAVKAGTLTLDAYEAARRQLHLAKEERQRLTDLRKELEQRRSSGERAERTIPLLIKLDGVDQRIASYSDLPALRPDFASVVREALKVRAGAREALREAEQYRSALERDLGTMTVAQELLDAEPEIRNIAEKSVHVARERADHPKRTAELIEQEARLSQLREHIGAPSGADLAPLMPPVRARQAVSELVQSELSLRTRIEAVGRQVANHQSTLKSLRERQQRRVAAGFSQPLGIEVSEFRALPRLISEVKTRDDQLTVVDKEAGRRLNKVEFSSLDQLQDFRCPDATAIQAEIDRRAASEAESERLVEVLREQQQRHAVASSAIARLKASGEVPTDAAIVAARAAREATWQPIRATYLSDDAADLAAIPLVEREEASTKFEAHVSKTDQLADHKSTEAQRITDLAAAERQRDEAQVAIESAQRAHKELEDQIATQSRAFAETWPETVARTNGLVRLKMLVNERDAILALAGEAQGLRTEASARRTEIEPGLERLALAETRLGIAGSSSTALHARIVTVQQRIAAHEKEHADWRTDAATIDRVIAELDEMRRELQTLNDDQVRWNTKWQAALREIGLSSDATIELANEVVTEWSTASGVLDLIRSTRRRLEQFDSDERALKELIDSLAPRIRFRLPDDPVAAARMLSERLEEARQAAAEKRGLESQFAKRTDERDSKQRDLEKLDQTVEALCAEANADEIFLVAIAGRYEQLLNSRTAREQILEQIATAGDGRLADTLRTECAGRDLDVIRAELADLRGAIERALNDIEAAYATVQERRREFEKFDAASGINTAVGERERAAAQMWLVVERYLEVALARELLEEAVRRIRSERQNPLIDRAGELFALTTRGAFSGIGTDIDDDGTPVVVGKRAGGGDVAVDRMSDGTRDQLFLAFRLASIERYCAVTEPLPFVADDLLVHFDDDRTAETLALLAEFGRTTQVLLFTHHRSVRDMAGALAARGEAKIVELV
jgi:uncharacterized protein YhaN